jgi:anthranilate 1,2-dioxygenase (deaminating, decarboxylating) large subunit
MSRVKWVLVVAVLFSILVFPYPSQGLDLPPVNLGFTSFLDGGPPAGPGWYFSQYFQNIDADRVTNSHGGDLEIPIFGLDGGQPIGLEDDLSLDAWISLSQFIYQSKQEAICGSKWGLDLIVPQVWLDLNTGASNFLNEDSYGVGDILVGPYLQWDPIMGKDGPLFMHRIEFQMIFPTGEYDSDWELNPGSNHFSFNPYWAATWFVCPKVTASWRLHYLWNSENDDPNQHLYPGADKLQPGQAIHLNFAADYELVPKTWRVGVNGYFLDQITDSKINGHDAPHSQEQVFAIGPGLLYSKDQDNHLFMNLYFETDSEYRTEGQRLNIRYVHHFK